MKRCQLFLLMVGCCFFTSLWAKPLVIGVLRYNPPFEMQDNQKEFSGFEANIMYEVCKRIHRHCIFKPVLFHHIEERIRTWNIDAAIGSIIITSERKKSFLFSIPYKTSYLQYVTLSRKGLHHIKDITGKKLGVYQNSPAIQFSETLFKNQISLVKFYNSMKMLGALQNESIDAVAASQEQAIYWQANFDGIQFLGNRYPVGEGYGIMCNLQSTALVAQINQALIAMQNDGTIKKLIHAFTPGMF